ncbi:MAG TPA: helix-turn-helix domain-containing protein [Opitutaceae bacterium]|nr:helix-turn-helix domain-containing protein [Opitutaceae bacterium]HZY71850.1 helix-turn-helix domain-containing protein [Edaphobacter sp.]
MSDPREHWEPIETEEEVVIPTEDGLAMAETIKVVVPAHRDPKTGEVYLGEAAIQKMDDIKARYMGILTRTEIAALRQRLHCTQKELCALLQIGEKTWTRWETGRERPSRSMNLLLRALNEGRIDIDWLLAKSRRRRSAMVQGPLCLRPMIYSSLDEHQVAEMGMVISEAVLPGLETAIACLAGGSAWMQLLRQGGERLEDFENLANVNHAVAYRFDRRSSGKFTQVESCHVSQCEETGEWLMPRVPESLR